MLQFFAWNGFPCPTLQNPSDHFLKTINKDFDVVRAFLLQYNAFNSCTISWEIIITSCYKNLVTYLCQDIEQGVPKVSTEEVIDTLVKSFRSSPNCQEVLGEVAKINKQVIVSVIRYIPAMLHLKYTLE